MANLIATEAYAQSIGGTNINSFSPYQGCTKARAIIFGCEVAGTYEDNQLVCQKDLSKASTVVKYSLRSISPDYLSNFTARAGSCKFEGALASGQVLYSTATPSGSSWSITVNGYSSTAYMIYPNPSPNIYDYKFDKTNYIYDIYFQGNPISMNLTRVFILSKLIGHDDLIGSKNNISYWDGINNCIIYAPSHATGYIGSFKGNKYTRQNEHLTMINNNQYDILYTTITGNDITTSTLNEEWKHIGSLTFFSNTYKYSFNLPT